MKIEVESKYEIGQKVHMGTLGYIVEVDVIGIQVTVRNETAEVKYHLKDLFNPKFEFLWVSLDHDLAEETTGYDVCKWIVNQWQVYGLNYWPKTTYLHTGNPVGRSNMFQLLKHYAPNSVKVYRSPMVID